MVHYSTKNKKLKGLEYKKKINTTTEMVMVTMRLAGFRAESGIMMIGDDICAYKRIMIFKN